jgi:hypothetical protein
VRLYEAVNDLKPVRPVVLMDELPWHELNSDGELTLLCEDQLCRSYEDRLRKSLYKWRHMRADMVMPNYFGVRKHADIGSNGIRIEERTLSKNDGNHIVSHSFQDTLKTDEDIDAVHMPTITPRPDLDAAELEKANELFAGILPVKLVGGYFSWAPWDMISYARGVTPLLTDLYDEPERMHRLMKKLLDIANETADKMEEYNLFGAPSPYVHCTAGYSSELPSEENAPERVKASQVWGRGTAQIFAHVSPEMHEEFDINYQKQLMGRFGLVYYGCCEPLHNKIEIVSKIPRLRKISITPWADVDIAAEKIGSRYVLASKPNPAFVAVNSFDPEPVRKEITRVLDACKRNGTPCEFVLKDISTANFKPENLVQWEKTAMETVLNYV